MDDKYPKAKANSTLYEWNQLLEGPVLVGINKIRDARTTGVIPFL